MYSKEDIYNLALGALLLERRVIDSATEKSNEVQVLNTHYDTALRSTLQDMDLDSTSTEVTLELIEADPTTMWLYSYRYPVNCAFFRRIVSSVVKDNRSTQISKRILIDNSIKVIYTNEQDACAEIIPYDFPLVYLSAPAGLAVAYKLAMLAAPLNTGKGARKLREDINLMFVAAKADAQELDRRENFNWETDDEESELVEARLS